MTLKNSFLNRSNRNPKTTELIRIGGNQIDKRKSLELKNGSNWWVPAAVDPAANGYSLA